VAAIFRRLIWEMRWAMAQRLQSSTFDVAVVEKFLTDF